jgi:DNA-binding SARP family transcriptional activator
MQVCVLGSVEVWDGGEPLASLAPQTRRLLAVLAATPGRTVSASRIAEYVAAGRIDGSTVRTAVARLRKVLGNRATCAEATCAVPCESQGVQGPGLYGQRFAMRSAAVTRSVRA